MFDFVVPSFARLCMEMKLGIAIAARMPMITTTIISSMRVKPLCRRMVSPILSWFVGAERRSPRRPRRRPRWFLAARELQREACRLALAADHVRELRRVRVRHDAGLRRRRHERTREGADVLERHARALRA